MQTWRIVFNGRLRLEITLKYAYYYTYCDFTEYEYTVNVFFPL